jgi:hypothetical protein
MQASVAYAIDPDVQTIWRGRIHFGDEPGIRDDAPFVGLASEWPLTVRRFERTRTVAASLVLRVEAEDVAVFAPSEGHRLSVARFVCAAAANGAARWERTPVAIIGADRLTGDVHELTLEVPDDDELLYLGLRLDVDTTVAPGLCNDFVVRRLGLRSTTHYASFGFQFRVA